MVDLVERELRAVEWEGCSTIAPGGGGRIPEAVRALVEAGLPAAADAAYWRLDNHVVVQGRLFGAAARPGLWLFYALLGDADAPLRERLVQILTAVDKDRARVAELLAQMIAEDEDARVRAAAAEFQGYMPGVVYEG